MDVGSTLIHNFGLIMDSEPQSTAAKRQRTDDEAAVSPPPVSRVPAFWFEEGNIILQLESKQYRVHKSILSMHSNFFKDLFQVPQPENEPLIEGCQVVQLFHDSVRDLEQVLSHLYYPYIMHDPQKTLSFASIAAMIRLGRKYGFTRLQANALRRLQTLFPKTLSTDGLRGHPQFTAEFLLDVINLAEENSIKSILPAAYLQLCLTCSLDPILNGVQRKDGTQLRLSHESMTCCVLGREDLASQLPTLIFPSLLREPTNDPRTSSMCPRGWSSPCNSSFGAIRAAFLASSENKMKFLKRPEGINQLVAGFCVECKKAIVERYTAGRKSVWDQLPSFFELPNWGDLKDF